MIELSRKKTTLFTMKPWQTPAHDCRARNYVQVDVELFCHPAYIALHAKAKAALLFLMAHCAGQREFSCTYIQAERAGISPSSFAAALDELAAAGFIRVSSGRASMQKNVIAFINDWKDTAPGRRQNKPRGKSISPLQN